jgi:uncharacterized protein YndB with AHSA1/START domain
MDARAHIASDTQFFAPPRTPELHIAHHFDAPVELVFRAWTDPTLMPEWWGPAYLATEVQYMHVRAGGGYRILQRAPDGKVHGFRGVYHTVAAPNLIISTFEYEGYPDHVSLDTFRYAAEGGGTAYSGTSVFQSLEDRDDMVATDCEPGVRETMARMEALLQRLKGAA